MSSAESNIAQCGPQEKPSDTLQPSRVLSSRDMNLPAEASRKRQRDADASDSGNEKNSDVELPVYKRPRSQHEIDSTKALRDLGRFIAKTISQTLNLEDTIHRFYLDDTDASLNHKHDIDIMNKVYGLVEQRHRPLLGQMYCNVGGSDLIIKPLQYGIRDAHNQDVRQLKEHIKNIYSLEDMPEAKDEWGFRHPQTALLLRPVGVDTGSSMWTEMKAGRIDAPTNEWAAFMYQGRAGPSHSSQTEGFLMDTALTHAARVVLFPKRHVYTSVYPTTGFAAKWNIKTVTPGLIAYVVELVYFLLSSETDYGKVVWDFTAFYQNILAHLLEPRLAEKTKAIIEFWDKQLFGQAAPTRTKNKTVKKRRVVKSSTALFLAELDNVENPASTSANPSPAPSPTATTQPVAPECAAANSSA